MRLASKDIFEAIAAAPRREFLLKLSAFEIYNERVRDLLLDGTERQNLPLHDDPERGTYAENLTETGITDADQLAKLLRQVEARRTVRTLFSTMTVFVAVSTDWRVAE